MDLISDFGKVLGILAVIAGGFWAIVRFGLQQSHERQKPFYERQMHYYCEAVAVASELANLSDPIARKAQATRFWQLYWGELAIFEDVGVEQAMVNFGNALQEHTTPQIVLLDLSLALAHACRRCLEDSWGAELGPIGNLRPRLHQD